MKPESSPSLSQKSKIIWYMVKQSVQFRYRPSHGSGCFSPTCHFRGMSVITGQSVPVGLLAEEVTLGQLFPAEDFGMPDADQHNAIRVTDAHFVHLLTSLCELRN
jgi:hypothetical protein